MSGKVAILISAPRGGGAEKSMRLIHTKLVEKQFNSLLVSINRDDDRTYEVGDNEINLGRAPKARLFETLSTIIKFNILMWRYRPDTLILNCEISELLGTFCLVPKCLVIVVEHANPSWEGRQKLGNAVRKILCIRKSRYVAVSEHIKPPFPFNEYLAVIPNPIDNDSTSNKHEVGNQIKRLVYVGRLAKVHKNPGLLLQISQEVKIPVVYFGDGELRNNLTEQAISMGVSAEFRGWVENPWRELSPYDLLIVPSEHEGDGLVVVEAILRGVPVVMRNVEDLIRFHLPNHHYCTSLGEFVLRINLNLLSLQKFVPPHESRLKLQESRNLNSVVDQWLDFISLSKRNTIYPDSY